jgi:hypothetical protein
MTFKVERSQKNMLGMMITNMQEDMGSVLQSHDDEASEVAVCAMPRQAIV